MVVGLFFISVVLFIAWVLLVFAAWQQTKKKQQSEFLNKALALWPLCLVDSVVRIANIPEWYVLVGIFRSIPVIVSFMILYHLCKITQPETQKPFWLSLLLCLISIASQVPLLTQPINEANWISDTPVSPLEAYWWMYLTFFITSGATAIAATKMTETIRAYHRFLPWQAVDVRRYYCSALTTSSYGVLAMSLLSLCFLFACAAEVIRVPLWPVIFDLSIAVILLSMLCVCVLPHGVNPSPLDYKRLFSKNVMTPQRASALVSQAETVMISSKSYKEVGLTVQAFSELCNADPTELVAALKIHKKQDFRGFIFHYRMEYARNVVMRSDASIAAVAKRLGFHSEKFLSGPFLSYLEKRK